MTRAIALIAFLILPGCVAVDATPDRVRILALGQVAAATGCPATARPEKGGTAEAGDGESAPGSPCVAIQGGPISSTLGNVLSGLGGIAAGALLP